MKTRSGIRGPRSYCTGTVQDRSGSASVSIYAPRPVSTVLWSAPAVEIFAYEPGTGLDVTPSRTTAFAGVDLDLWLHSIVTQLDALLTAEFAAELAAFDRAAGRDRSEGLRVQRERIATALAAVLTPVREPASGAAEIGSVVRQVLRARLADRFGDLYETQAVLATGPETLALLAGPETVHGPDGAVVASSEYRFGSIAVGVPLVLRRFPDPPVATTQSAASDAAGAADPVDAAKRWRFRCAYARPFHDPRDVVAGRVEFGVRSADEAASAAGPARAAAPDDAGRIAFAGLAQFVVVFPQVVVDLRRLLREVGAAAEPDAATIRNASAAVDALLGLLQRIDLPGAAAVAAPANVPAGDSCVEFVVAERASDDGRYVVTLALASAGDLPLDAFTVYAGDPSLYVPQALPEDGSQRAFVYLRAGSEPAEFLSAADGQRIAERAVEITGLDAFARPNARAAFSVRRNVDLPDAFVYRTPAVAFAAACAPSLDVETPLVLDASPQPIQAHLAGLFAELFAGAAMETLVVSARISYAYDLANQSGLPPIVVPVALLPPSTVAVRGAGSNAVLASWQETVVSWFASMVPQGGGTLRFDLTLSADDAPEAAPLLHLGDVQIPLAAIEPRLVVAETSG